MGCLPSCWFVRLLCFSIQVIVTLVVMDAVRGIGISDGGRYRTHDEESSLQVLRSLEETDPASLDV